MQKQTSYEIALLIRLFRATMYVAKYIPTKIIEYCNYFFADSFLPMETMLVKKLDFPSGIKTVQTTKGRATIASK